MKTLDCCAGAGGLSLGLQRAGFDVFGVELDEQACETHRLNVGPCDQASLWDYSPREEYDLVAGGIPCFVAGTMILTREGFRPIEELIVGDVVLTHLGRWRSVTCVMKREGAALRAIKAQGVPGIVTTDEHPFYARRKMGYRPYKVGQTSRIIGDPAWVEAKDIDRNCYLGQTLPPVSNDNHTEAFWWFVGRYLADGWICDSVRKSTVPKGKRGSRINSRVHKIVLCCNHSEESDVARRIADAKLSACITRQRTVCKFHINSKDLVAFLRQFGRYAHGKRLPRVAMELEPSKARALLDGYFTGDGCVITSGGYTYKTATTVSRALALGIGLLAQRAYGVVACVSHVKMPNTCVIEGRVCNQRDQYQIRIPPSNRSAFVEGEYGWKLVRRSEPAGVGTVYNISVEEDESYVADGAIVHNCQSFSIAGKRKSTCDPRGQLYVPFLRIAQEANARAVLIENVRGMLSSPSDTHGLAVLEIEDAVIKAGFAHVTHAVLDAVHYGVPQKRQRLFIVGFRSEEDRERFSWPLATHAENGGGLFGFKQWGTVRDALKLGDAQFANGKTPEAKAKGWRKGGRFINVDQPSYTVMTGTTDLIKQNILDKPSATVSAGGTDTGGAEPFANAKYRKKLKAALVDQPAPTVKANSSNEGADSKRPSRRKFGELGKELGVLDKPAPTIKTRFDEGEDKARPSRRPTAELRKALAALDKPAPCVSASEQKSALSHRSKGGKANPRRCGDVLNPALAAIENAGLADRPSTTVDTTGRLGAAGHHTTNKHGAARVTVDQLRALQAFPEGFTFVGTLTQQHKQVGNAVPVPLAEAVGGAVFAALGGAK